MPPDAMTGMPAQRGSSASRMAAALRDLAHMAAALTMPWLDHAGEPARATAEGWLGDALRYYADGPHHAQIILDLADAELADAADAGQLAPGPAGQICALLLVARKLLDNGFELAALRCVANLINLLGTTFLSSFTPTLLAKTIAYGVERALDARHATRESREMLSLLCGVLPVPLNLAGMVRDHCEGAATFSTRIGRIINIVFGMALMALDCQSGVMSALPGTLASYLASNLLGMGAKFWIQVADQGHGGEVSGVADKAPGGGRNGSSAADACEDGNAAQHASAIPAWIRAVGAAHFSVQQFALGELNAHVVGRSGAVAACPAIASGAAPSACDLCGKEPLPWYAHMVLGLTSMLGSATEQYAMFSALHLERHGWTRDPDWLRLGITAHTPNRRDVLNALCDVIPACTALDTNSGIASVLFN